MKTDYLQTPVYAPVIRPACASHGAPFYSSAPAGNTADRHLAQMRAMLDMTPSRDASLWQQLDWPERRLLLTLAKLPAIWCTRNWASMTQSERVKIHTQMMAGRALGRKMGAA
jgi:hypothetical protein